MLGLSLAGLLLFGGVAAAAAPATEGLPEEQKKELAALKTQARGRDLDKALEALEKIETMGPATQADLVSLVKVLLTRTQQTIESAVRFIGSPERIAPAEKKLTDLRAEAVANIAKLKKEDNSVGKATVYYNSLLAATTRFGRVMDARSRMFDAAIARKKLLETAKRLKIEVAAPARSGTAVRPTPVQLAEKALGVSLDGVEGIEDFSLVKDLKALIAYRLNRRIMAENKRAVRGFHMHVEEARNAVMVNNYREALGLTRLVIDKRLVEAARGHSKEMVEMRYFSHTSPTKGQESFSDRVKAAGYPSPGGENIAQGPATGGQAFMQWFNSPPHHQNMVRDSFTAIGVGLFGRHWTQNFGQARRQIGAAKDGRGTGLLE